MKDKGNTHLNKKSEKPGGISTNFNPDKAFNSTRTVLIQALPEHNAD